MYSNDHNLHEQQPYERTTLFVSSVPRSSQKTLVPAFIAYLVIKFPHIRINSPTIQRFLSSQRSVSNLSFILLKTIRLFNITKASYMRTMSSRYQYLSSNRRMLYLHRRNPKPLLCSQLLLSGRCTLLCLETRCINILFKCSPERVYPVPQKYPIFLSVLFTNIVIKFSYLYKEALQRSIHAGIVFVLVF